MNAPTGLRLLDDPHAGSPSRQSAASNQPVLAGAALAARYRSVRARSVALVAHLSPEDCCVQSMPDASPVKWHLAHTTWFFETFLLERFEPAFQAHHPAFRVLFNSYYNGVGERHLRAERGLLTRPAHAEVLAYRADVDERIMRLLENGLPRPVQADFAELVVLGLQHEQQHQELIVTDMKHLLSRNPLQPAWQAMPPPPCPRAPAQDWLAVPAGVVEIGHRDRLDANGAGSRADAGDGASDAVGFCFDNELPRHRQFVERFALATRLVTNGEFRAFVEDGGYRDPALWLAEGWNWLQENAVSQPLYWQHGSAHGWQEFTLAGLRRLDPNAPLLHVSLYEADAYARWAGAVLPTEAQWEAAVNDAGGAALTQVFDTAWQWTLSSYAPYPGYAQAPGALGEYNGKFMINQYVLRGASQATPPGHSRASYRNFFPAATRWQFSGIRLARPLP
jgi:ergothioneine biosynthesis protein EgtB